MNSGAAVPYSGTEPCGFPRGAVFVSGVSHGSIFGCSLKSVNHEQPVRTSTSIVPIARCARDDMSALTTHLLRTMLLEKLHGFVSALGGGLDPDAEVTAAESRIVAYGHREARNPRQREHSEHRGETAD